MARTDPKRFLHGAVGAGDLDNRPEDVIATKRMLREVGLYKPRPEGLGDDIDAEFDAALRRFQKERGLVEDGTLLPGGETERNLVAARSGEGSDPGPSPEEIRPRGSVGEGGENEPEAVALIKRAFGALGRYPYDRTRPPPPYIDAKLVDAIRDLQHESGLHPDGRIDPEGKTVEALRRAVATQRTRQKTLPNGKRLRPGETQVAVAPQLRPGGPLTGGLMGRAADAIDRRLEAGRSGGLAEHPDDPGGVNDAEAWFHRHLNAFRRQGLNAAAENLEHYLSGEGTPRVYTRGQVRGYAPLRRLERKVQNRFTGGTFLAKTKSPTAEARKLAILPDGKSFSFKDDWKTGTDEKDFIRQMFSGDTDFALAAGRTGIVSEGNFTAQREGDIIRITGIITHKWTDKYDFEDQTKDQTGDDNQPGQHQARILERMGKAKPFNIEATWQQRVEGTVKVMEPKDRAEDGTMVNSLGEPQFRWTDLP
jgi:peptidoglycan hydrolase-like protein with peptidoglycan-binding domain